MIRSVMAAAFGRLKTPLRMMTVGIVPPIKKRGKCLLDLILDFIVLPL
jgi:hypothetical protein